MEAMDFDECASYGESYENEEGEVDLDGWDDDEDMAITDELFMKLKKEFSGEPAEVEALPTAVARPMATSQPQEKESAQRTSPTRGAPPMATLPMAERGVRQINALAIIIPDEINSITEDGWEEVETTVDSGASETVIGVDMLSAVELREGPAKKRGVEYEVANGVRTPNLGEKKFIGTSDEGISRQIVAQVCDVNKPLLSVRKMVNAGSRVIFDKNGSYIEDSITGDIMEDIGSLPLSPKLV